VCSLLIKRVLFIKRISVNYKVNVSNSISLFFQLSFFNKISASNWDNQNIIISDFEENTLIKLLTKISKRIQMIKHLCD